MEVMIYYNNDHYIRRQAEDVAVVHRMTDEQLPGIMHLLEQGKTVVNWDNVTMMRRYIPHDEEDE